MPIKTHHHASINQITFLSHNIWTQSIDNEFKNNHTSNPMDFVNITSLQKGFRFDCSIGKKYFSS